MSLTDDERKELERFRREKKRIEQREKDRERFYGGLFRGLGLSIFVSTVLRIFSLGDTVESRIAMMSIALISMGVGIGSNYYGRFKEDNY